MKNIIKMLAITAAAAVLLTSCQDLFMTSAFSFVEPDITKMGKEQQISYAEDLLANGTEEELEAAYEAIEDLIEDIDSSDGYQEDELDLLVLGADLAIGASGIGEAIDNAIDSLTSPDETDPSALADKFLESFDDADYTSLEDAVTLIETAEAEGAELTPEQYTNAAAAQLLVVLHDVTNIVGVENPEDLDPDLHTEVYNDLQQALDWAEKGGLDPSIFGDGIVA